METTKVLDLGVGSCPWMLKRKEIQSPLYKLYPKINSDMLYVGLDNSSIRPLWKELRKTLRSRRKLVGGKVVLVEGNGKNLPFADDFFDIVILSDILSMPEDRWQSKNTRNWHDGLGAEDKIGIINESFRVLKRTGVLVVGVYQTWFEATTYTEQLKKDRRFCLITEYNSLQRHGFDLLSFWDGALELALLKNPPIKAA